MDDECEIKDVMTTSWNYAAIEKAKELIESAIVIHFVPVALLTTKHNYIVSDISSVFPYDRQKVTEQLHHRWSRSIVLSCTCVVCVTLFCHET